MQEDKTYKSLGTHPTRDGAFVYMWIAHYDDGTSLPQYDLITLKTNGFREVKKDKLIKFGLYPFPSTLARRLKEEKGINVKSNIFLPKYEVKLDKNKRVIGALTTNFLEQTYRITCPKCRNTFDKKEINGSKIGNNIFSYICPSCGLTANWLCPKCGKTYRHIKDAENWHCSECGNRVKANRPKFIVKSTQERWRIYKLGYQETINGVNTKTIMHIQENGDVELKSK